MMSCLVALCLPGASQGRCLLPTGPFRSAASDMASKSETVNSLPAEPAGPAAAAAGKTCPQAAGKVAAAAAAVAAAAAAAA